MQTVSYPAAENLDDPKWQPLVVTADLVEPIVNLRPDMHLDGPLSFGAFRAYTEEHGDDLPPVNPHWAVDFEIPLAKWAARTDGAVDERMATGDGSVWGWACSRGFADALAFTRVDVRKRPPLEQFAQWSTAKSHHLALGPYKARNNPHPATVVRSITWFALGEPEETADLLHLVTNLGRLSRHGNGLVAGWTVAIGGDRDAWRDRVLPGDGPLAAIRAPYHHASRKVPCLS